MKDFSFRNERILRRELLIAFVLGRFGQKTIELMKDIAPLDFDGNGGNEYIKYLVDIHPRNPFMEEVESRYEDAPFDKRRAELVDLIGIAEGDDDTDEEI